MDAPNTREEQADIVHLTGIAKRTLFQSTRNKEMTMWTKPEVTEMRFGFEVTMYVCNR